MAKWLKEILGGNNHPGIYQACAFGYYRDAPEDVRVAFNANETPIDKKSLRKLADDLKEALPGYEVTTSIGDPHENGSQYFSLHIHHPNPAALGEEGAREHYHLAVHDAVTSHPSIDLSRVPEPKNPNERDGGRMQHFRTSGGM